MYKWINKLAILLAAIFIFGCESDYLNPNDDSLDAKGSFVTCEPVPGGGAEFDNFDIKLMENGIPSKYKCNCTTSVYEWAWHITKTGDDADLSHIDLAFSNEVIGAICKAAYSTNGGTSWIYFDPVFNVDGSLKGPNSTCRDEEWADDPVLKFDEGGDLCFKIFVTTKLPLGEVFAIVKYGNNCEGLCVPGPGKCPYDDNGGGQEDGDNCCYILGDAWAQGELFNTEKDKEWAMYIENAKLKTGYAIVNKEGDTVAKLNIQLTGDKKNRQFIIDMAPDYYLLDAQAQEFCGLPEDNSKCKYDWLKSHNKPEVKKFATQWSLAEQLGLSKIKFKKSGKYYDEEGNKYYCFKPYKPEIIKWAKDPLFLTSAQIYCVNNTMVAVHIDYAHYVCPEDDGGGQGDDGDDGCPSECCYPKED